MKKNINNKDVPIEAVLRSALVENGKLKSEIDYLTDELNRKNKAIAAFKKWQSKVATYKYSYWLTEGWKLMMNLPDEHEVESLRKLLDTEFQFRSLSKKVKQRFESFKTRADQFAAVMGKEADNG